MNREDLIKRLVARKLQPGRNVKICYFVVLAPAKK
jgi:hypothetical protein